MGRRPLLCRRLLGRHNPGPEPVPSGRQELEAVHPGHAQDGRFGSYGEHLQAEASEGLVAVLHQEGERGDGAYGGSRVVFGGALWRSGVVVG